MHLNTQFFTPCKSSQVEQAPKKGAEWGILAGWEQGKEREWFIFEEKK